MFLWKSLLALFFSIRSSLSSRTSSSRSLSSLLTSLSSYLSSLHVSLSVSTAPPWTSSTASRTLFWSWFSLIDHVSSSSFDIFKQYFGSFTMFTERFEDWLIISLGDESFNQHRRYFTHVTHHCLHAAAGDPLPSFPKVGWRKLWRKSDTAWMHQGIYSPFL